MTTEQDRLKVWMAENDITPKMLAKRIRYSEGRIKSLLASDARFSDRFKITFEMVYGETVASQIIDPSPRPPDKRQTRWNISEEERAMRDEVKRIVGRALYNSSAPFIPDPRRQLCHGCLGQARLNHHCSYRISDAFCFVPLCYSCHTRVHNGTLVLTYGIVPTIVGSVRIAIAGLTPTP